MSTYRLVIEADTEKAKKDIKEVERVADTAASKKRKFDFQFPSTEQVAKGFTNIGKVATEATKQTGTLYKVLRDFSPLSDGLQPLEAIILRVGRASVTAAQLMGGFINTGSAMNTVLGASAGALNVLIERLAVLGFALQGFKGILAPLQQAFSGFFNATIGRAAAFKDSILQTQTTLAATAKVFVGAKEITDPFEKIQVLTGSIEEHISNIQQRTQELAGVTTSDVVEVFNVVAGQISSVNGDLQDAEDLAVNFAAALGTMGIPLYQMGEEIRSIMQATIGPDSRLAKALMISNADVERAKSQVGGVVEFIEKKLEAAVSGQRILAKGLTGVLSNIEDIKELVGRMFGEGLLQPIIDGLTWVYDKLVAIAKTLYNIAAVTGRAIGNTLRLIGSAISQATEGEEKKSSAQPTFRPITQIYKDAIKDNTQQQRLKNPVPETKEAITLAAKLETLALKALSTLSQLAQEAINNITRAIRELRPVIDLLLDTVAKLVTAFAKIKIAQFQGVIQMVDNIAYAMSGLLETALEFINLWYSFKNLPIVAEFVKLKTQLDVFKQFGGDILINIARLATFVVTVAIPAVKSFDLTFQQIWINIKAGVASAFASLTSGVNTAKAVLLSLVAAFKSIIAAVIQFVLELRGLGVAFTTVFGLLGPKVQAAILQVLAPFKTLAIRIVTAFQQANVELAPVIERIKAQLTALGVKAQETQAKLANVNIGSLTAGLKGLGGMLASSIAGFIAFDVAFAVVLEGLNRYQKAQDEIKNKKEVQNAVKELAKWSGVAAANMSELEKSTLAVNKALVESRFNNVKELVVTLENRKKQANDALYIQSKGKAASTNLETGDDFGDTVLNMLQSAFTLENPLSIRARKVKAQAEAALKEFKTLIDALKQYDKERAQIEADSPAGRLRAFQTELDLRNAQRNVTEQLNNLDIARGRLAGTLSDRRAEELQRLQEIASVSAQIKDKQELLDKKDTFNLDTKQVEQLKAEIAALEARGIQLRVDLNKQAFDEALRQMQVQAGSVERSMQFQSTVIAQNLNLTQARNALEKARLDYVSNQLSIEEQLAALNNGGVAPDQLRLDIAARRRDIAIQQAKIEYSNALAAINAAVKQAQIDQQRLAIKANDVRLELQLAAARKQDTTQFREALAIAQDNVKQGSVILNTTIQIAEYQRKAAAYNRDAAIETANAALKQNQVAIATERAQRQSQQFASNMQSAASAAGNYASNMQDAASSAAATFYGTSGGGGGGGSSQQISLGGVTGGGSQQISLGGVTWQGTPFPARNTGSDPRNDTDKFGTGALTGTNTNNTSDIVKSRGISNYDPKVNDAKQAAFNQFVDILASQGKPFYRNDSGIIVERHLTQEEATYLNALISYNIDQAINAPKRARVAEAQRIGATFAQFSASAQQAAQQVLASSIPRFALGGVVDRPTVALLAEAGEREFVIPESKMATTASRYLSNYAPGESTASGTQPINITTGPVLEFNGERYVTMSDFERGLRATAEGVIGRLRTPSARIALGMR